MAEFGKIIITTDGQALIAKTLMGSSTVNFVEVAASETEYKTSQLETLSVLSGIKQVAKVSKTTRTNDVAVQIEAAVTNTELKTGYYMRTLGLYANDPNKGKILYGVTAASVPGWMPPYNGVTVSGAFFKLVTTIGNSTNVTLNVDPSAVATIGDIEVIKQEIALKEVEQQNFGRVYFSKRSEGWNENIYVHFWDSTGAVAWDWNCNPKMKKDKTGLFYFDLPGNYDHMIFANDYELGTPKTSDLVIPSKLICKTPIYIQHPYGANGFWADRETMTRKILIKAPAKSINFERQNLQILYRNWSDKKRTSVMAKPLGISGFYFADVPVDTDDFILSLNLISSNGASTATISDMMVCSSSSNDIPIYIADWETLKEIGSNSTFTNFDFYLHFRAPAHWDSANVVFRSSEGTRVIIADCIDPLNRIYRVPASRYDETSHQTMYDEFKIVHGEEETNFFEQFNPNEKKVFNVISETWINYPTDQCAYYVPLKEDKMTDSMYSSYLSFWDGTDHKLILNTLQQIVSTNALAAELQIQMTNKQTKWIKETINDNLSTVNIYPYRLYIWGTKRSTITIGNLLTNANESANTLNEYMLQFIAGSSFTIHFPSSVTWKNGVAPTFTENATYQIKITNNIARVL